MTRDEFRRIQLKIPTAVERLPMDHPDLRVAAEDFRVAGIPDENWGMVKLTLEQQRKFIRKAPKILKPSSGTWGRQG